MRRIKDQYFKPAFGFRLTNLHIEDGSFEMLCKSNRCGVVKAGMCDLAEFYKAKRLKNGMIFSQFNTRLQGQLWSFQSPRALLGMAHQDPRIALTACFRCYSQLADVKPLWLWGQKHTGLLPQHPNLAIPRLSDHVFFGQLIH